MCIQNDNEEVRSRLRAMSQDAAQKEAWLEDQQERHARRERSVRSLLGLQAIQFGSPCRCLTIFSIWI